MKLRKVFQKAICLDGKMGKRKKLLGTNYINNKRNITVLY